MATSTLLPSVEYSIVREANRAALGIPGLSAGASPLNFISQFGPPLARLGLSRDCPQYVRSTSLMRSRAPFWGTVSVS